MAISLFKKEWNLRSLVSNFLQLLGLGQVLTGAGLSIAIFLGLAFPLTGAVLIGMSGLLLVSVTQMFATERDKQSKTLVLKIIAGISFGLSAVVMTVIALSLLASLGFGAILNGIGIVVMIAAAIVGLADMGRTTLGKTAALSLAGLACALILTAAFGSLLFLGPGVALGVMLAIALVGMVVGMAMQPFYSKKKEPEQLNNEQAEETSHDGPMSKLNDGEVKEPEPKPEHPYSEYEEYIAKPENTPLPIPAEASTEGLSDSSTSSVAP